MRSFSMLPCFLNSRTTASQRILPAEDRREVKIFHALRRGRPNRGDAYSADFTGVIVKLEENIEERFDAVCAGEHNPIVPVRVLHELRELAQIARRLDPDCGQFDDVRAKGSELVA
jgi:hypothetical protein